jgi:hypothetical protein
MPRNSVYILTCLLIDFYELFNLLAKYASCLIAHICVNSCFRSRNEISAPKVRGAHKKIYH